MSDRLEENKAFEQAVKGFSEKQGSRPYLTDKLEGFSSGWLAAREFFTTEVKRLREEADVTFVNAAHDAMAKLEAAEAQLAEKDQQIEALKTEVEWRRLCGICNDYENNFEACKLCAKYRQRDIISGGCICVNEATSRNCPIHGERSRIMIFDGEVRYLVE